jgi:hypothetical protein
MHAPGPEDPAGCDVLRYGIVILEATLSMPGLPGLFRQSAGTSLPLPEFVILMITSMRHWNVRALTSTHN